MSAHHPHDDTRASGPPARTVLIVEDSKADRVRYRHHLAEQAPHWTILEAETGAEGLERIASEPPDCVLLDYWLPDMDGPEFLQRLNERTESPLPAVPVAIATGSQDWGRAEIALEEGAEDYIVKGTLSPLGLVRVIENTIEKHRVRRELEAQRAALEMRTWQLEITRAELQQRLTELATATESKDQFMAVMSHEMRTPLNAILGYAELLELGVHGPLGSDQRELIERIRVGGRHLLDLINDVLDLARADAREIDLNLEPVDLIAVAEEVTRLLERDAAERGIEIRLLGADQELPPARGDVRRVRQILTNLMGNAVKFTDEGSVTLDFDAREDVVAIRVRDTGIGIDPDLLPLVFDRFFQADSSYTRKQGGSGLGLAIARRLAQLMDGDIDVDSRVGEGSEFTLRLPVWTGADAEVEAAGPAVATGVLDPAVRAFQPVGAGAGSPDAGRGVPAAAAGPPVTVVAFSEDEGSLAALSEHVAPSVRLIWTTEPDEVRPLAIGEDAGLVVLDVSAARGAGWAAAHSLQDVPELLATAVLLLPSLPQARPMDGGPGLDLGWVSLVPKPFTEEQLTTAVSRATAGWSERRSEARLEERRPVVLVVDDDPDSRHVARSFLRGAGLTVREAEDGESALVSMRMNQPQVVVLDLMMPVLDGFGVLAAMRADPRLAAIPVVVLSAKSLSEPERRFLARSAARVLQKGQHRLADVAALVIRAAEGMHPAQPPRP